MLLFIKYRCNKNQFIHDKQVKFWSIINLSWEECSTTSGSLLWGATPSLFLDSQEQSPLAMFVWWEVGNFHCIRDSYWLYTMPAQSIFWDQKICKQRAGYNVTIEPWAALNRELWDTKMLVSETDHPQAASLLTPIVVFSAGLRLYCIVCFIQERATESVKVLCSG